MWDCADSGHVFKDSNVCEMCGGLMYATMMPDGNFMMRVIDADEVPEQPDLQIHPETWENPPPLVERVPEAGGGIHYGPNGFTYAPQSQPQQPQTNFDGRVRKIVREELADWLPITPPDTLPE